MNASRMSLTLWLVTHFCYLYDGMRWIIKLTWYIQCFFRSILEWQLKYLPRGNKKKKRKIWLYHCVNLNLWHLGVVTRALMTFYTSRERHASTPRIISWVLCPWMVYCLLLQGVVPFWTYSSSWCRAASMDFPDLFLPPIYRSWQLLEATSCIDTELL